MKTISLDVSGNDINRVTFNTSETIPDVAINMFSEWLTEYINEGAEFETDQTIQFGWSYLMVQKEQQVLKILAPDFQSMPIRWIEDLTLPLHFMTEQKYVAESYSDNIEVCNIFETAIIGKNFHSGPFIMRRYDKTASNPRDSGWFIGSMSDDVDNQDPEQLSLMSLYEIHLKAPLITPFLWLPEDYEIVIESSNSFHVFHQTYTIEPKEGSYIAAILQQ